MNHTLLSIIASLMLFFNLLLGSVVQAQPLFAVTETVLTGEQTRESIIKDLKSKIIPEIESILTPEQNAQLETSVVEGKKSLRKAFKSLVLTPDQKTKLAAVFKTLPSKEVFISMTPEEKKSFFIKQKSVFMPTPEEIGEKINAKRKMASVRKDKDSFDSSTEEISKKIGQKMEFLKDKLLNLSE
jgi:hypothetical protein